MPVVLKRLSHVVYSKLARFEYKLLKTQKHSINTNFSKLLNDVQHQNYDISFDYQVWQAIIKNFPLAHFGLNSPFNLPSEYQTASVFHAVDNFTLTSDAI